MLDADYERDYEYTYDSDNLLRRHIHGTSSIDERAILLEGDGSSYRPARRDVPAV